MLTDEELKKTGELSRQIMKDEYIDRKLCCNAPKDYINKSKDTILFIGMNPAGDEKDVKREEKTKGLFLNYYEDLEKLKNENTDWFCGKTDNSDKEKAFIYGTYFRPILEFFENAAGKDKFAWEWCNCLFDELKETIEKVRGELSDKESEILRDCHSKYENAQYQIVIRDLVYYHQTSKFNETLKSEKDVQAIVLELLDKYIDMIPKEKLKLIYISSATSCKYIESALSSHGDKMDNFGIIKYNDIPVLFAGRPLNGAGVIDKYSKIRLMNAVKKYIK